MEILAPRKNQEHRADWVVLIPSTEWDCRGNPFLRTWESHRVIPWVLLMEMIVSGHLATMEAWELPTFSSETNGGGWKVIRFMTEILHHLVCLNPVNYCIFYISSRYQQVLSV